jgi:hypothetical protein
MTVTLDWRKDESELPALSTDGMKFMASKHAWRVSSLWLKRLW